MKHLLTWANVLAGAICLWLFTTRILGHPYRGFRIAAFGAAEEISKLSAAQRMRLRFFVWWRYYAGTLLAALLAGPLNMMLGTMGISAALLIAPAAALFATGPVVMKMLVGSELLDFRIEARRPATPEPRQPEPTVSASSQ